MEQVSFERLLAALRRQWWVVLQAMLVVSALAGWYTSQLPLKPYHTQTSFLVRPEVNDVSGNSNAGSGYYAAQLRLLQSDDVMKSAGLTVGMTGDEVRRMTTAWVDNNSGVVTVRATSDDPNAALAVANALVDAFVTDRQAQRNSNLEARRATLEKQLSTTSDDINATNRDIANKEDGWDNGTLDAQRNSLLAQYQTLFEEQQQVLTQIATQAEIIERLDTARVATRSARPDPAVRGALGAILGLVIGGSIAALRETLDTRIRNAEQMARATELPLLVELPALARSEAKGLSMLDRPDGAFAESVRSLQTTIRFMQQEDTLRVLAVSSAQGGDGKTTVAANLAVSFALSGFNVVLVSGDLRRATIDERFVTEHRRGLTDLLLTRQREDQVRFSLMSDGLPLDGVPHAPVSQFLQATTTPGLQFLATGSSTSRPAELLASPQLMSVIDELRDIADIVVIDCPPAIVADALVLGRVADSTLLVASEGRTNRERLGDAADRFRAARVPLLGVAANRVGANRRGYYGRYSKYGRYGSYYSSYYSSTRTGDKNGRRHPAKARATS